MVSLNVDRLATTLFDMHGGELEQGLVDAIVHRLFLNGPLPSYTAPSSNYMSRLVVRTLQIRVRYMVIDLRHFARHVLPCAGN